MDPSSLDLLSQIEYDAIVNYIFQAEESIKYEKACDYRGNIEGNTYEFRTVGTAIALPKENFTLTPVQNPQFTPINVILNPYQVAVPADELQMETVNFNVMERLAGVVAKAVKRRLTQIVIDAMAAGIGNIVLIGENNEGMTYPKFTTARRALSQNSVPIENRFGAFTSGSYTDLLNIEQFTSNFFNEKGFVRSGQIPGGYDLGFEVEEIPEMPEGGLPSIDNEDGTFTRTNFCWQKLALGMCMGDGIKTYTTFENMFSASWVTQAVFRAASIIVQAPGIVAIQTLETGLTTE